jgi:hypothetical protein
MKEAKELTEEDFIRALGGRRIPEKIQGHHRTITPGSGALPPVCIDKTEGGMIF